MNTLFQSNGFGYVYTMYGNIGMFYSGEQSSSKPRSKRFSKRKFSWAVRYLLSCIL